MRLTPEEYRVLANDRGFNALLAQDAELRRLESLKHDKALEARFLMESLGVGDYRLGKLPVRPLTVAKWAFLWMLESPFVTGEGIAAADIDVMLYVLSVWDIREVGVAPHEIPAAASGYLHAAGLATSDVLDEVWQIINVAFLPLEMLPSPPAADASEPVRFDGMWVTHAAGLAARESGMPFSYCTHRMSLSTVCAFFVNWRKREGTEAEQIRHRPGREIQRLMDARINDLMMEFLHKNKKR